jgi:hypothetical protein
VRVSTIATISSALGSVTLVGKPCARRDAATEPERSAASSRTSSTGAPRREPRDSLGMRTIVGRFEPTFDRTGAKFPGALLGLLRSS